MKKLFVGKRFSWDIQECIPKYFQATGTCEAPQSDCNKNGDCPTITIITVMACDVNDACRQIKSKIENFKLSKLVMFTKPALHQNSKNSPNQDPTCNVDVTPSPTENCGDCCDLFGGPTSPSSSHSSSEHSSTPFSSGTSSIFSSASSLLRNREFLFNAAESIEGRLGLSEVANYSYVGSGSVTLYGSALIDSDDLGELGTFVVFSETISDVAAGQTFVPVPAMALPQTTETVSLDCCSAPFTLTLELKHTFQRIGPFAAFLRTNGYTLPGAIVPEATAADFVKLNYNIRENQWRGNLHFSGQSPQGNFTETWNFGIQFGCDNGGQWNFSLATVKEQPDRRFVSRLLIYYDLDAVCPLPNVFFGFKFAIDVQSLQSDPAASQPIVINDDAGLFRNLRLIFRILPQNVGSGSHQSPADNEAAYMGTLE